MPDDTQIDLRKTVAELRRELDARTAERDEALAREAAVAEVLQIINSSPGDLAPVFDAMLDKAMRLCGAAFGQLRPMTASASTPPRSAVSRQLTSNSERATRGVRAVRSASCAK